MEKKIIVYDLEEEPSWEAGIEAQVEDFQRRLDGMNHLYREAVYWAAQAPATNASGTRRPRSTATVTRSVAGRCGQIMVAAGTRLVEWSQVDERDENDRNDRGGGPTARDYIVPLPPIRFDL